VVEVIQPFFDPVDVTRELLLRTLEVPDEAKELPDVLERRYFISWATLARIRLVEVQCAQALDTPREASDWLERCEKQLTRPP